MHYSDSTSVSDSEPQRIVRNPTPAVHTPVNQNLSYLTQNSGSVKRTTMDDENRCKCGLKKRILTVRKECLNKGRRFIKCGNVDKNEQCD